MAGDSVSDCQPRSTRLAGMQRQHVVAELFPSLTDIEGEDNGVEFYWRGEDGEDWLRVVTDVAYPLDIALV